MADDLSTDPKHVSSAPAAAPAAALPAGLAPVERREERRHPIFRFRFAIAYLALAVVAGTGIGLAIVLFQQPEDPAPTPWSAWVPAGRETSFPDQIADFVGANYRGESGNPLVAVIPSPPEVQDVPLQAVAIRDESPVASVDPKIEVVRTSDSLMYTLCGLGQQCSIAEGTPSRERLQVLRREALELSLYTFKYVDGVGSTIVLLPPNLGENRQSADDDQTIALFLRKRDYERELARPLRQWLIAGPPPPGAALEQGDAQIVDRLTVPHLFQYQFQQVQTGGAILVLAPVTPRR